VEAEDDRLALPATPIAPLLKEPTMLKSGLIVAVILTVLTILEYIFAVNMPNDQVRFVGLAMTAISKAILIIYYFMHVNRVWQKEAH
jgi:heme/copper-type cytochrome/quinol oxidase subunit 4